MAKVLGIISALVTAIAPLAKADDEVLLRDFATCAGRYSAQMEWQWLMQQPGADASARQRAAFVDLITAVSPDPQPQQGRRMLSWRINAKHAHSALLHQAEFATNHDARLPARYRAESEIRYCDGLLLSG